MRTVIVFAILAASVVLGIALILIRRRSHARAHHPDPSVMQALRRRVFEVSPEQVGAGPSMTEPFAVVMDLGMETGTATVFAAATGDASLYISTGGGVIGGIGHDNVRRAAIALVREAAHHRERLQRTNEYPYPAAGHVRFYVRTREGVFVADRSEDELGYKRDALWPLFYAGQDVITQLRTTAPELGQ